MAGSHVCNEGFAYDFHVCSASFAGCDDRLGTRVLPELPEFSWRMVGRHQREINEVSEHIPYPAVRNHIFMMNVTNT